MHKLDDTDDHTADGGTETTKKQRPTSEDSKPDKQRTVKIEKVCIYIVRPLVKSAHQKINFLIIQPKHMMWVLKTYVKIDG